MNSFYEEKSLAKKSRVKKAIIQSIMIAAVCFSLSILFMSLLMAFANVYIPPIVVIKVWIMFFILGVLSVFRIMLATSKWAMDKPFIVPNLILMPIFLVLSLICALSIMVDEGVMPTWHYVILFVGVFLITFTVVQFVHYFRLKASTDLMNDALQSFHKEHDWDEEE